jgi:hypothetical protein
LRQAHLQRLGWRFHRIWSTDWFYHREQEIERAVAAFEEAVRWADALDADERSSETESNAQLTRKDQQPAPARRRGPRPLVAVRNTIDQYSDHELWQIADWIMSDGLLRTDEQLIAEIFQELPFERLGKRIRSRLKTIVAGIGHARKTRNVPR